MLIIVVCENLAFTKKTLANVVVIGAQWGDEGKGKITIYSVGRQMS
jgi:adenylosuccinate synthase